MIPYSRQSVDDMDIQAVVDVLQSDWLTTGPKVAEFEATFARFAGVNEAVGVSSGTAALHAAMFALDIGPGDEVIVPAMTFAATANAVVYQGGTPIFADVYPDNLLIDPEDVESKITSRTKAVVAVDYAGHPCDYDCLREITDRHQIKLVADACHAIGGHYKGRAVGSLADLSTFSFHPVKHLTTGEGGMITTDNHNFALRLRLFRNHGIADNYQQRSERNTWKYEMTELGYNYRISDIQCALGLSQLRKLPGWVKRRQEIASYYNKFFGDLSVVTPLTVCSYVSHAYHLYVIKLDLQHLTSDRDTIFKALRKEGIGVNVHYIPVHMHPYYHNRFGTGPGLCPVAEAAYEEILSLPLFAAMEHEDVVKVCDAMQNTLSN